MKSETLFLDGIRFFDDMLYLEKCILGIIDIVSCFHHIMDDGEGGETQFVICHDAVAKAIKCADIFCSDKQHLLSSGSGMIALDGCRNMTKDLIIKVLTDIHEEFVAAQKDTVQEAVCVVLLHLYCCICIVLVFSWNLYILPTLHCRH